MEKSKQEDSRIEEGSESVSRCEEKEKRRSNTRVSGRELLALTEGNNAFSRETPGLQLSWDSSSLTPYQECPYKYFLSIICGYVPKGDHASVHLVFGILYTNGCEAYDRARAEGAKHEEALARAIRRVLSEAGTRDKETKVWHVWRSRDPNKNLPNLLRTLIYYLDKISQDKSIRTLKFADGSAAVEKRFTLPLPLQSQAGEEFHACGYLDKIVKFGAEIYIADHKTTKNTINNDYFRGYDTSLQMYMYALAGQVVFGQPVKGILIEAAQAAVGFSQTRRGMTPRNAYQLETFFEELGAWIKRAEQDALNREWSKCFASCGHYGGCDFVNHCHARSKEAGEAFLRSKFERRIWDPTKDREG